MSAVHDILRQIKNNHDLSFPQYFQATPDSEGNIDDSHEDFFDAIQSDSTTEFQSFGTIHSAGSQIEPCSTDNEEEEKG